MIWSLRNATYLRWADFLMLSPDCKYGKQQKRMNQTEELCHDFLHMQVLHTPLKFFCKNFLVFTIN